MTEPTAREAVLRAFRWVDGHADIWRLFSDHEVFHSVVAELGAMVRRPSATKVAGIESRGSILGGAVALQAGIGFVPIRKEAGRLPGAKVIVRAAADYRGQQHLLRVQAQSIGAGDRVVLVDDWAERGGQAAAARQLIEACGGTWAGAALVVDQLPPSIRTELQPVEHIVTADELGPSA